MSRRRDRDPNVCSFCGAERPGMTRPISEKRGIYICADCAMRTHQIAGQGKQRRPLGAEPAVPAQETASAPAQVTTLPRGRHALRRRLAENRMCLLVSLPRNDPVLARVALEAGAEGLKVHLNVEHAASGTRFGSLSEEQANLEKILAAAGEVPVGLVPGAERMPSYEDMRRLDELGIDFFDAYADHMPAWMLDLADLQMSVMVAVGPQHTPEQINNLLTGPGRCPGDYIEMIEASIIGHEGYGRPLSVLDLAAYTAVVEQARNRPVIVPTQRKVRPAEVALLRAAGVDGLLIGAIVTGTTPREIGEATERFAEAIDRLPR